MWSAVAPAWTQNADYVDSRGAASVKALLDLSAPQPGDRVLDLACGLGGLGMAASPLVGPAGHVVLSDVVPEMVAFASGRVGEAGFANVSARLRDIESIDEPDASFDVVVCREGLMFALDPARAAGETCRVLRPGGRVALAVWGPRNRNPWLGVVVDCVSAQIGKPLPPPGMPGPFALDDADRLVDVLKRGGLTDITVTEFDSPLHMSSFEEWWKRTSALAGPIANLLATMPAPTMQALQMRLRKAVQPYENSTGLQFPGVTLLASARRPG
jgi:SAM-dependent methyltransferase